MPSLKNPNADLRRRYHRSLEISFIISLAAMIVAFKLSPSISQAELISEGTQEIIRIDEIINTVQKPEIPPPPKVPEIIAASTNDVPDDILLPDIDDIETIKLPDKPPKPNIDLSDEKFIDVPQELPQPVGGLKAIQEKIHFTEIAKRAGIEGTVYIEAKIDKKGNVVDAIVKKGLGAGLNEEALNAVLSTKFHPGRQRGKPVNVRMVIPIKFVLK